MSFTNNKNDYNSSNSKLIHTGINTTHHGPVITSTNFNIIKITNTTFKIPITVALFVFISISHFICSIVQSVGILSTLIDKSFG